MGELNKQRYSPPFRDQNMKPPGLEANMDPQPLAISDDYQGSEKLQDHTALITGGDSGIGRAVALHFAREGCDVAFTYLKEEKEDAEETGRLIESEGRRFVMIETDLSQPDEASRVVKKVVDQFERIDILVNNAAFQNHLPSIDELSFEQFRYSFEVNIFSFFNVTKSALPYMKKGSSIINTGSVLGYAGNDSLIDYASTKGAIHNFTKSLAQELGSRGIRVNSVAPGPVWTPLNPAERDPEEVKNFGKETIFKRPAQPCEIAPAFVFLASEVTGSYITGETINIFGKVSGAN